MTNYKWVVTFWITALSKYSIGEQATSPDCNIVT